ncbi:MAG: winged helix-turn-helix transcriptional regulator [Nitrospiria bacterium]
MLMSGFFALPTKDAELVMAVRLLGHESSLDMDIIDSLVGHPQRYSDLQKLLKGRNDTVLNRALARLRGDGLIQQHIDVRNRVKLYGLTALGKLVVYRLQQMRPHHESIEAYERGHAADSA